METKFTSRLPRIKVESLPGLRVQPDLRYSSTHRLRWQGVLFGLGSVAFSTLLMFLIRVEPYNVNMVFMLLTLFATVWFGLTAGVFTAIVAFLCFNFFFIPPIFTFIIDAVQGWIAVFLFLGTALFANQVAGRARLNNQAAQQRAREATALYQMAEAVLTRVDQDEMLGVVLQQVSKELNAASCTLFLWKSEAGGGHLHLAQSTRPVPGPVRHPDPAIAQAVFSQNRVAFFPAEGLTAGYAEGEDPAAAPASNGPVAYVPLAYGAEALGVIVLVGPVRPTQPEFSPEEKRLIEVFSNHLALAVEHARLIREAAQVATLRDSDRLKTALLDSVSHELRTPLTSIKTATANLQSGDLEWSAPEKAEMLGVIEAETNRLTRLVSNLLELSKIEGRALKPNWGWHYLPEIVEQVVGRLKRNPLLQNRPLTTHFAPDIGLSRMDYLQIDQVLTNLLDNAAKYSPPGLPITIQVEISTPRQALPPQYLAGSSDLNQPVLLVKVQDEGRGIPSAELERIFDKFYRVRLDNNPLHMDAPGTGIGLAITRGIVEAHGGQIWAQNRLYGGSVFRFTLPLVAPPGEEELDGLV